MKRLEGRSAAVTGGRGGTFALALALTVAAFSAPVQAKAETRDNPQYSGSITFSPEGVLFVGDNIGSAVFAYNTDPNKADPRDKEVKPFEIDRIDSAIARAIKTKVSALQVNDMAVHPITHEVYISLSELNGGKVTPAVVKVSATGKITAVDLNAEDRTEYKIKDAPTPDQHFVQRAWLVPDVEKYRQKAETSMRSMTIVDMKFHNGELYIAGISNEEFASTLRKVPYPFAGEASTTYIKIYHTSHAQYETRAPIRAMTFADVDGKDTLVAAYTCSPLVLIPVDQLKDGAKVEGRVVGDMGNGQPISMVNVNYNGIPTIFVTNGGHSPRYLPISGLQNAKVYNAENSPHHFQMDTSPPYPLGAVGKAVLFWGASLRADLLNEKFLISLTRDTQSGDLNLEALPIFPLPMKLDQMWSEYDFKGVKQPGE
jgi:hypothetical protein